jgi:hypothetical protein
VDDALHGPGVQRARARRKAAVTDVRCNLWRGRVKIARGDGMSADPAAAGAVAAVAARTRIVDEADARQLPALIAEWWDAPDHRRWLARALRIDLALLTEWPELVVPCLHRRCAWPGAPEEAGFYEQRAEVPLEADALRDLVQGLVRGWSPGAPWLRSLRPPSVPLDAGVLEEYRTSMPGELAFSTDGEAIGVVGAEGAIAWERVTGRRHASPARVLAVPPRARRWKIEADAAWGSVTLVSEHRRVSIPDLHDELAHDLWELGPELVLIDLYGMEEDQLYALVDLSGGQVRWRRSGSRRVVAPMPGGDAIAVATDRGIDVVDLASGELRAGWPVRDTSAIAVAPDGLVATRSGGVIRVWDPAVAAARVRKLVGTLGWTAAEFSIDGARLVTGALLCDGRTGALVAVLGVDNPEGWLVGGPPKCCQRMTTTAFAQILPFHLSLWDARDGSQRLEDEARRAEGWDVVAFDAAGRHHAIAHQRARTLRVYRLLGGELLYGRDAVEALSLGFSPDGAWLWWESPSGERWVVELPPEPVGPGGDPPTARLLSDHEPLPAEPPTVPIPIEDGLLAVGGAAIPCDDAEVIASLDGRCFASLTSHHALEDR